jgi:small ligand-binding sensory domain FIST
MKQFPYAHATHPQWPMAAGLVLAQLRAQMALPDYASTPTLGLLYITDHYANQAQDLLDCLSAELPWVTDWSGTVGVGIATNNAEYFDEPALAVMLLDLPSHAYRVFSGIAPLGLGFEAHTALVHADGGTPDVTELIEEMAARTDSGYLFGGLSSSRTRNVQFAVAADGNLSGFGAASGVLEGGLSGVAFTEDVALVSRVTQGCKPVSPVHLVTQAEHNLVLELDGRPALEVMLGDLGVSLQQPQHALEVVRATLVGLVQVPGAQGLNDSALVRQTGTLGSEVTVRHIIGLDPVRHGIAVAAPVTTGAHLAFCQRNREAAKADLVRICAEVREEVESEMLSLDGPGFDEPPPVQPPAGHGIAGAIYVSCSGRGGPHFGGDSAELQIVRRALGDVPLVGFFAGGEIARNQLLGYTGVLTVFFAASERAT